MIEDQEEEKKDLNNSNPHINRGFELMLRKQNRREKIKPKTFKFSFGKTLSLLKRELSFNLEFNFDFKKK